MVSSSIRFYSKIESWILNRYLYKLISYFDDLLIDYRKIKRREFILNNVTIGNQSIILDEASITNAQDDKTKIIIGNHTIVRGELIVFGHGGEIQIGDYCYIGENTRIWSSAKIKIGNRVLISHNVNIHDNISHPLDPVKRHQHFAEIITKGHPKSNLDLKEESIEIEDDVWIGYNASILKGVKIGKNSIIGANSIITKDVMPNQIIVNEIKTRTLKS